VLRLWETLWAGALTPHLHIYMAAAVLVTHRRAIMAADLDFDGLLRFCIERAGRLDLAHTLRPAGQLCRLAGRAGEEALAAAGLPPRCAS